MTGRSRVARVAGLVVMGALSAGPTWSQSPAPGRTVRVNDIEMYYEVRGSGEPLVLLHGFGGCGQDWRPHVDRLAERYQVILPDLRGHGRSTNPSGTFSHRQAAMDLGALLDRLGLQRVRAMGISSGGMTLLHLATRQPERVESMVLIGATSHFPEPARVIFRRVASDSAPAALHERFRRCVTRGDAQHRELLAQFGGFKDSYDDMNFTAPYLGTIRARTLVVHGDRDEFFPVDIPVEMYRAIPRAALWIVPRGGHVPIFGAHAREFLDVTLSFLQTEPGPR